MSKKQQAKLQQCKKAPVDKKHQLKKPDVRRTVSGRAIDKNHCCKMKICVFQTYDNRWHLHAQTSSLEHSFHPELDDDAKALGEKDLDPSQKHLVSSKL
jgi:glutamine amidotransferase PdxT